MKPNNLLTRLLALSAMLCLAACAQLDSVPVQHQHVNPEAATGYQQREKVTAPSAMVASANPLATQAGYDILRQGGNAVDAAIAMQLVLGLVEPQSSGIGGGGFILAFNPEMGLDTIDGRETAPSAVNADLFSDANGQPMDFWDAVNSGQSVGVPGLVAAMALAHQRQGRLAWETLFEPAIRLANDGFEVSPRLHQLLSLEEELAQQPAARRYFFNAQGQPWPVGHRLRNPQLAQVYQTLAKQGARAFYEGPIAEQMVTAVRSHSRPGQLSIADLKGYKAVLRDPLCTDYRMYVMCGMGPPSAGSLAVMQMLALLQHTPIARHEPTSAAAIHYFSEAARLAFADRDAYVADPSAMTISANWLLDANYIKQRAALIRPDQSLGTAQPGQPEAVLTRHYAEPAPEIPATTHSVAVDEYGGMVSMTTSVESAFGSKIFTQGFLLNNQLTDFSFSSMAPDGQPVRNQVAPNKRPRSSMAPMMVFENEQPVIAVGSPGGSAIILYVAKTLLGVLDWNLDIQQAISLPNYGSRNQATELEEGQGLTQQADVLRSMGHDVIEVSFPSGIQGIERRNGQWVGGADPRREGKVMGY